MLLSLRRCLFAVVLVAATLTPVAAFAVDGPLDLHVNAGDGNCSDAFDREQASSRSTPWCTVARAGSTARPGDTVHIWPGRYVGTVRPVSGEREAPLRFVGAAEGVFLDAGGADAAVKLVSVTDVVFQAVTITGATMQGVWMDGTRGVVLENVTVERNTGHGIQVLRSEDVRVQGALVRDNAGAGIFEGAGTTGGRYVGNRVESNGLGSGAYNGDGIQLGGTGAYVARNTIVGNGTPGPYEHGIYAGPPSREYVIEENLVSANSGSNIKAAGAGGVVRYNRIENGRLGLVFSDNPQPVSAYYNLIVGSYQHAVFLTIGETAAQAKIWNNTIVVTSRSASSGDASAVFVKAATLLDFRNNVVSYTNEDLLGRALYVSDSRQLSKLISNNNWFSTRDASGRHLVRNGSRMTLSAWRKATGQDAKSIASAPPAFDQDARITSKNLGIDRGQSLGLTRDYAGRSLSNTPDLGAYER